jgi:hypothetical protein
MDRHREEERVGAAGAYEARCRRCFEPGLPSQENLALFPNLQPETVNNGRFET